MHASPLHSTVLLNGFLLSQRPHRLNEPNTGSFFCAPALHRSPDGQTQPTIFRLLHYDEHSLLYGTRREMYYKNYKNYRVNGFFFFFLISRDIDCSVRNRNDWFTANVTRKCVDVYVFDRYVHRYTLSYSSHMAVKRVNRVGRLNRKHLFVQYRD